MKPPQHSRLPRHPVFAVTLATLALFPLTGSAANIIINPVLTTGLSGGVIQNSNTFGVSQVSATQVKVTGLGEYTSSGGNSVITMSIGGLVSAVADESVSLDYDFNLNLTGGGSVSWTLNSLIAGAFAGPSDSGGPILSGAHLFTGSKSVAVPVPGANIPWSAVLTVNWSGATAGNTLAVSIPNNSIDFAVVPEPSSMLLLSLGGVFLARRRR